MIRRASDSSDWNAAILHLIEDVARRRAAGEVLPDHDLIAANPHLMPELGERLVALRSVGRVVRLACDGSSSDFASASSQDEQISIPGYALQGRLGRGAMGAVYRATCAVTGRAVAIKVLHQAVVGRGHDQPRFDREARILAQLRHPNIVAAYDVGVSQGRLYFVMEYVAGQALDQYLATRKLPIDERLRLFLPICEGVHAAHLHGVIHRDLKPSNIIVDNTGAPHLLDFGLAKLLREDADPYSPAAFEHSMTMTGQFVGSLPWASPEQVEGVPSKIDLRTDVYSLGVILYQMLAQRFPYPVVGRIRDVMNHILESDPARPSTIDSDIPSDVETIVLKCLAKLPQRRYQSARDLAEDIRCHLSGEPIEAKRDSNWYLLRKKLRRHRVAASVGSGFLALSLMFSCVMLAMYSQKEHEALRAQQTLSFLQDTLFQASSHRLGSGATLSQVLDHAVPEIGRQFGDEPLIEASLRYTVGSALETIWRKREAVEQLRTALDLQREHLGPDHHETLRTMVLLGMVMAETGDFAAIELEREALARRVRLHGSEHQLVADVKTELAFSLWFVGQPPGFDEAERLYQEALRTYAHTVGEERANLARAMQSFAFMRLTQGRPADAELLFRRSLDIARRLLGDDHQFTIEGLGGLSDAVRQQGNYAEAEALLQEVIRHVPRLYGEERVPFFLRQLAEAQSEGGSYVAAEESYRALLARLCRQYSQREPSASLELERVANQLEFPSANQDASEGLIAFLKLHGAGAIPADVLGPGIEYAAHLRRRGDFATARATLEAMRGIAAPLRGTRWRGEVEMAFGALFDALNQSADAAKHLELAHMLFSEDVGKNHRRTLDAAKKMADLRGPAAAAQG